MRNYTLDAAVAAMVLASFLAPLHASAEFADGLRDTKLDFNVRYRMETVDQDGIEKNARASTAKARLSWIMPSSDGFSMGLEGDHVFVIGEERYNSTTNGLTEYPVVADPTGFDLNQAYLRYRDGSLTVTMGRQRILHGGQRFAGGVAWRQNEQTYDAVRVQSVHERASIDYSHVFNVRRIFGPDDGVQPADWEGNSHLFRLEVKPAEGHAFGGFVYLMNFENDNGPANANRTYGIDYAASFGAFGLKASIAKQSDWADNPRAYDAGYYSVEASLKHGPATYAAGYEVLGSDAGNAGFRTPIATLHKFQGWVAIGVRKPALPASERLSRPCTSSRAGQTNSWPRRRRESRISTSRPLARLAPPHLPLRCMTSRLPRVAPTTVGKWTCRSHGPLGKRSGCYSSLQDTMLANTRPTPPRAGSW